MRIFTLLLLIGLAPIANAGISLSKSFVSLRAPAGSFDSSDTIFVRNVGNESTRVNVFSGCFSDFRVSNGCFTLERYGSCSIQVQFSPRTRGSQSCTISVNSSTGGGQSISVRGEGY